MFRFLLIVQFTDQHMRCHTVLQTTWALPKKVVARLVELLSGPVSEALIANDLVAALRHIDLAV